MAQRGIQQGIHYTEGSVVRGVVRFSLPYLLSYLLQTLYGLADLFIIGQFAPVACVCNIALDYLFIGALSLGPTCAATSGTLCSPESTSASAAISARAVARSCRFCTTSWQSC